MNQISLFDGSEPLKLNKKIRLIELFAGYGSQSLALKYLGVPFEHWAICEWAVKSIQAYKDIHFADDNTDYAASYTDDELVDILYNKGISSNYNEPMTKEQIKRLPNKRAVYNNIVATNNLVSVCNVNGEDLNIVDTDKYTYIMSYSFPCQDLSKAGKGAGMGKDSGTRSGLLWEVERILNSLYNRGGQQALPQCLLMENVPDVIGTNNIKHFAEWVKALEKMGYTSKWEVLNAKDYGVPQNRERCFMVSWLGDYYYDFPQPIRELNHNWVDDETQHKYFTKEDINKISSWNTFEKPLEDIKHRGDIIPTLVARGQISNASMVIFDDGKGLRNLTPRETFRLMGVRDNDFNKVEKNQSNNSLFHLSGDSIVVDVLMAIFKEML